MPNAYADIAFTPIVREEQRRFGSADAYARVLSPQRDDGAELGPREAAFLSARDGVFQATVSETGWPYVPTGQRHDDRVSIIAVDYACRKRLKLWGHVRITEDADVVELLNGVDGPRADRGIVIRIDAFDWNCPKHIPIRLTEAERAGEISQLRDRIEGLERDLARKTSSERELSA